MDKFMRSFAFVIFVMSCVGMLLGPFLSLAGYLDYSFKNFAIDCVLVLFWFWVWDTYGRIVRFTESKSDTAEVSDV